MAKAPPKIPLSTLLSAIDNRDKTFYKNLTDDQKKAYSSFLAMRYASSVGGTFKEHYLIMTNEFVNVEYTDIYKHPELQWLLLSIIGVGKSQQHPWVPVAKKKKKNKLYSTLKELYPTMKHDDIELLMTINTKDDMKELLEQYGYDKKEIKEITK